MVGEVLVNQPEGSARFVRLSAPVAGPAKVSPQVTHG
ncbi:hypothetical protein SAMN07250955_107161 [Arboricoccus pini]|uniref:Uncharacterized protein n=1 Tax=Arboricoccus pini TaxID=1963835 RepID=A0A212RDP6_9PROT|nr:hypothetical protein SAMN07250955_107161 [Arboricoccus pini]